VVEVGISYQHKLPRTCHSPVWKGYSSVLLTKRLARYLRNAGRMGWVCGWWGCMTYHLLSVQKHFTRSDRINQLWSNKYSILWVCVYILAWVIRHANSTFSAQHYIFIYGHSCSTILFYIISWMAYFLKKLFEHKMCVLIIPTTFFLKYFSFYKEFRKMLS
jgi:hypothetical protein